MMVRKLETGTGTVQGRWQGLPVWAPGYNDALSCRVPIPDDEVQQVLPAFRGRWREGANQEPRPVQLAESPVCGFPRPST